MDPNTPNQPPSPPPPWSTQPPAAPDPIGAPPPFPGEVPTPAAPWAPGTPMPGAPWVAPKPAGGRRRLGIIAVVIVVIVAAIVAVGLLLPSQAGKVVFVTTAPHSGDRCNFGNTVTSINQGTDAWVVIVFKNKMDDQPVSLDISMNGTAFPTYTYPVSNTQGFGCVVEETSLKVFPAGDYKFVAHHRGEVEAEGELVIK